MSRLTITAKGQVTFRQSLLRHLGVGPGQKIEAEKLPEGRIIVSAAEQKGTVDDFIGCLAQENTLPLSIDEINEIAAQGWAGEK